MIGASPGRDDSVVNAAERAAQRLGIALSRARVGGSDHASFERVGIPAVFLHRGVDPNYHQAGDVAANVTIRNLEETARLALAIVQDVAQVRTGAVRRRASARAPGRT